MTEKKFHELSFGDYVADMHYGEAQLRERFDVVSHVRWDEPVNSKPESRYAPVEHSFSDYIEQFHPNGWYLNKMLRVIGFGDDSTLTNPSLICAYCYDGRRSGIIVLREKKGTT